MRGDETGWDKIWLNEKKEKMRWGKTKSEEKGKNQMRQDEIAQGLMRWD